MLIPGPVSLEADVSVTDTTQPTWVLSHPHPKFGGSMSNKVIDLLFRRAHENGISVVRFNFRGVGKSAGMYDEGVGEQDDLKFILRHLSEEHGIASSQTHLIGYSFGSVISALVAADIQDIAKLTMIAPPTELATFPTLAGYYPKDMWMPELDEYSKPAHAKAYFDTLHDPKTFHKVQGADHFFVGKTKEFVDAFFQANGVSL